MKKERTKKEELLDFLEQHCEIKSYDSAPAGKRHTIYILHTRDCVVFMAEAYIQGMRNTIGQDEERMRKARKSGDYSEVIMVYNWSAPDPGMDMVQIPETLIRKLDKEQATIFLRNLKRIQQDIDEGKAKREALRKLFGDKAEVRTTYALDGERQFFIQGVASPDDRRGYAERYAEHAATNILFDLPKALNAQLQPYLPEYARGQHFVVGRRDFYKKMRYGAAEAHTELVLTNEGADTFINIVKESPQAGAQISRIFQQAITDPVGLSLKFYLGKNPLI